ncbi:dephospho-CoA kinase [Moorella sulfitireducens (nom. illeg.)]|uniref:dephospho-CoA kinase n=1 Tax=Neomoorella sulfitireducens TaxID=2972948 RepID=UPI00215E28E6|nr:dephospho-CoA kinase [Moorella sulfitireducens]
MFIIGLTGGIASGKSTVAGILKELGAKVIDTDQIAREVVLPGQPAYRDIVAAFGGEILYPDGNLNRRALGRIVFSDANARELLNAITHPRIRERVQARIATLRQTDPGAVVVVEAPLLIEAGMNNMVDAIWVVTAPAKVRLKRLMERDNLSLQEAESRLRAQIGEEERLRCATRVIPTGGDLEATRAAVLAAWREIPREGKSSWKR